MAKTEDSKHAIEQLRRYKQSMQDIRYIIKQYSKTMPKDAWETIKKLAHDPKLRLKNIKGQFETEGL